MPDCASLAAGENNPMPSTARHYDDVAFQPKEVSMQKIICWIVMASLCAMILISPASGKKAVPSGDDEFNPAVGDSPDTVPALAHLSPALQRRDIAKAMRKVGDWELKRTRKHFDQDWTFAALYAGFITASETLPNSRYEAAMVGVGNKFDWKLGPREAHADDQAIGQTYVELYRRHHDAKMVAPLRKQFDALMTKSDDLNRPVWWWCDALFMAPRVWAGLAQETGEKSYLDYMDREWWVTSDLLYDSKEHLYSRDATFLNKYEANGKKIFWSRGNGWVLAGLARVLEAMPQDYPSRAKYVEQFRQMASRVAELQGSDGLWRPGLLNADGYPLPEVSGSAFFIYAITWGVNHGILQRKEYLPLIERGWSGVLSHVYDDGRLGCIQPVGAAPGDFKPTSSYVYGVGAFLLAGSELQRLADK
jgi:unsaturated rhamnogalacturonyl hydrolase